MTTDKKINFRKCGEMLIDINTKVRKNKMFIFQCTFCNIECDQLKKFSLHIGQHLASAENSLKETILKLEDNPVEIGIQSFANIEKPNDIHIGSCEQDIEVNPDPLETRNPLSSDSQTDNLLVHDVKIEQVTTKNINTIGDNEDIDFTNENYDSQDKLELNSIPNAVKIDTESEDDILNDSHQIPLKKRNILEAKRKKTKEKHNVDEIDSDDSKDTDNHMEKGTTTAKTHKRCKKRWKNIDDSKLPILIEMYKKYEVLWQVNDIAFGILPKRNETFGKMIEELKSKHNFDKNLDELQDHIDYINYIFYSNKEQELKCEIDNKEFKPTSKYYKELNFLSDSQGPFKCTNCNEIITKYDRYHIHVAQHNGTIPFQCRLCEMGFQKFDNYLRHVTRHLGINSYHCNVCGKGYPFKSELDWHLTSHTGVKPYLCPICGAGFRARHGYDNHIRRHEKRFRYECHICKHGFNHLCKLNTHIKSHLNIRDVICNVCGKGFTAAKYLQRHKLIHEEEKRYKCNVCGKAFAQDSGLRTHRKQHQPYATIAENRNLLNKDT